MPPASRMASAPSGGDGRPAERWTRPAAANVRAVVPMPMRWLDAWSSGARSRRSPSSRKAIGRANATRPSVPAATAWMTSPATPCRPHHSRAATTMARAMNAKPMPSRRCSGSRSRAEVPMRRTVPPATWAIPIQVPRTARSGSGSPPPLGWALVARVAPPRGAGLRDPDEPPRPAAGREDEARPEEPERVEEEVMRVATFAGYAKAPPAPRVTRRGRCAVPASRAVSHGEKCAPRRDGRPRCRYLRCQVMSASVQPRLAGRQPSSAVGCSG